MQGSCVNSTQNSEGDRSMEIGHTVVQNLMTGRPDEVNRMTIKKSTNNSKEDKSKCTNYIGREAQYKFNTLKNIKLVKRKNHDNLYLYEISILYNNGKIDLIEINKKFNINGSSDIFLKKDEEEYSVEYPWLINWKNIFSEISNCN
jgi:hypothetical protein